MEIIVIVLIIRNWLRRGKGRGRRIHRVHRVSRVHWVSRVNRINRSR